MKRFFNWMLCATVFSVMMAGIPHSEAKAQPGGTVSFQLFYDELSPYGQWIDDPEYGYVWAPDVDDDFRPYYTNGRWAMTEYGNTWVSGYDWGWAPFHYGRWTWDSYYGWIWVPDNTWGPAWVNWRSGGGYYGWAPMGPGVNINISFGNYYTPYDWWTFIPCQHIYSPNYYSYWRGPGYNNTYISQTTIINNYYNNRYVYGPRRNDIERYTGGRVSIYNLRNQNRPGRTSLGRNELAIYRPNITERGTGRAGFRAAPRNVVRADRPLGIRQDGGNRGNDRAFGRNRQEIANERDRGVMNRDVQRSFERDRNNAQRQPVRSREQFDRAQRDRQMQDRFFRGNEDQRGRQNEQRMQMERQRTERENMIRGTREREMQQRQNEQRMQMERQRTERENMMRGQRERQMQQRQNEQRMQVERQRAERENMMRGQRERQMQQRQNEQRMQMERQRAERENMMRGQRERQMQQRQNEQRMQMERQRSERSNMMRQQQMQQQQREWRRPEPQQPRMERQGPGGGGEDRGRGMGRGR